MLQEALEKGEISDGHREILDSSSGNTGISLASFGTSLGFKVTIVLPESASIERQKLLQLYGATIIFSDPMEVSDGAIGVARDLMVKYPDKDDYINQYSNPANWKAHYFGTAEEIWKQTAGKITHLDQEWEQAERSMGTGRRMKE